MTPDEIEALGETSKREGAGILLPSGVRVFDLIEGTGPEATPGRRVYAHYKVWSSGFREGAVADFSFFDERPCEHREILTPELSARYVVYLVDFGSTLVESRISTDDWILGQPTDRMPPVCCICTARTLCTRSFTLCTDTIPPPETASQCGREPTPEPLGCARVVGGG